MAEAPRSNPMNVTISEILTMLTPDQKKMVVTSLRQQMLPLLLSQLNQMQIPRISDTTDTSLGKISFDVNTITLADVVLPAEELQVNMQNASLTINADQIAAKLNQFDWSYRKHSFPKLKDGGHADARIADTSVSITINFAGSVTNPVLDVTRCEARVGKIDVKISGSAVSFLYNLLIAAFSTSIKRTVEGMMKNMLRDLATTHAQRFVQQFLSV
jgi:hypothetical protein